MPVSVDGDPIAVMNRGLNVSLVERARRKIQEENHERLVGEVMELQEQVQHLVERQNTVEKQTNLFEAPIYEDPVKLETDDSRTITSDQALAEQVEALKQCVEQQSQALLANDRRFDEQTEELSELRKALETSRASSQNDSAISSVNDVSSSKSIAAPQQPVIDTEHFIQRVGDVLVDFDTKISNIFNTLKHIDVRWAQYDQIHAGDDLDREAARSVGTSVLTMEKRIDDLEAQLNELKLTTKPTSQADKADETEIRSNGSKALSESFGLQVRDGGPVSESQSNASSEGGMTQKVKTQLNSLARRLAVLEQRQDLEDRIEAATKIELYELYYKINKEWQRDLELLDEEQEQQKPDSESMVFEFDVGEMGRFILRQRVMERLTNWDAIQKTFVEDVQTMDTSIYENREPQW